MTLSQLLVTGIKFNHDGQDSAPNFKAPSQFVYLESLPLG
jgi:hypothetical protein